MKKALMLALLLPPGTLLRAEICRPPMPPLTSERPIFINFDKSKPEPGLHGYGWEDDRAGFGNLDGYTGHQLCGRGVFTECRGKPEMILRKPEALQAK
jgi:hypothetical protein